MSRLVPCDVCGHVPSIQRSHSSRRIAHRCRDFDSGWHSQSEVVAEWNGRNSLKNKESTEPTTNTGSPKLLCQLEECQSVLGYGMPDEAIDYVTERLNAVVAQLRAGA